MLQPKQASSKQLKTLSSFIWPFENNAKKLPDDEELGARLYDGVEGVGKVGREGEHVVHTQPHFLDEVVHLAHHTHTAKEQTPVDQHRFYLPASIFFQSYSGG